MYVHQSRIILSKILEDFYDGRSYFIPFFFFVKQGSTIRKRKIYEDFLSKVSILGNFYLSNINIILEHLFL